MNKQYISPEIKVVRIHTAAMIAQSPGPGTSQDPATQGGGMDTKSRDNSMYNSNSMNALW